MEIGKLFEFVTEVGGAIVLIKVVQALIGLL